MKKVTISNYSIRGNEYVIYFNQQVSVTLANRQHASNVIARCSDFFTKELYRIHAIHFGVSQILADYGLFINPNVTNEIEFLQKLVTTHSDYISGPSRGPNFNPFVIQKTREAYRAQQQILKLLLEQFKKSSNTAMIYKVNYYQEQIFVALSLELRLNSLIHQTISHINDRQRVDSAS